MRHAKLDFNKNGEFSRDKARGKGHSAKRERKGRGITDFATMISQVTQNFHEIAYIYMQEEMTQMSFLRIFPNTNY